MDVSRRFCVPKGCESVVLCDLIGLFWELQQVVLPILCESEGAFATIGS